MRQRSAVRRIFTCRSSRAALQTGLLQQNYSPLVVALRGGRFVGPTHSPRSALEYLAYSRRAAGPPVLPSRT